MKKTIMAFCLFSLLWSCGKSPEQATVKEMDNLAGQTGRNDKLFVFEEHAGAIREREFAKIIMAHSQDSEVKELAKMVRDGHQAGIDRLESIALELKVALIDEPLAVDLAKMELFKKMTSEELTRYYLIHQQSMHGWDIAAFTNYAGLANNASLKKYVVETIAPLKEHEQQVLDLSRKKGILPVSE